MSGHLKIGLIFVILLQILSVLGSSISYEKTGKHPLKYHRQNQDSFPRNYNASIRRLTIDSNEDDDSEEPLNEEDLSNTYIMPQMNNKYLSYSSCGQNLYCQTGSQGPCYRNEVCVPRKVQVPKISCRNTRQSFFHGCRPMPSITMQPSIPQGSCVLRNPSRPCLGYPSDYRYCQETKRCHSVAQQYPVSPCGPNKVFREVNQQYGACVCQQKNCLEWNVDHNCYPIYTQAQCSPGQWLVPQTPKYAGCEPCPCPGYADGQHIYWNQGHPGCYQSYTKGPCPMGQFFYISDYVQPKAQCIPNYYLPTAQESKYY